MSTEAARTAHELQMLEGLVDCAHVLGVAFGTAANDEADFERCLERTEVFQKCFLAVRMGIRLCMSLRAGKALASPGRPATLERSDVLESERPELERDPMERETRERPEPLERERDRERDYEPVSLPRFLATLGVVARDAARDDRLPAGARCALPALQTLLAEAEAKPGAREPAPTRTPALAVLSRPAPAATRERLLGSVAPPLPGLRPRGPRPRSGFG
ncbi:hypothetical protein [Phenylobacterium sp.]|uniref:hypothetical protein n=1 Tax=Phenylobacterium sp. TaxID=1871053 RepID=UPI0025E8EFDF|nr:hypothetical protein [Phenylobacterium sp.]